MTEIQKNCRSCKHFTSGICNIMFRRIIEKRDGKKLVFPYETTEFGYFEIEKVKLDVAAIIGEPIEFSCSNWE